MRAFDPEPDRARQLVRWHGMVEEAAGDLVQLAQDGNAFAMDLYRGLREVRGNLLFSPFSVSSALAMAHSGAGGETAAEIAGALHITLPRERFDAAYESLLRIVGESMGPQGTPLHELAVANGIWVRKGEALIEEFVRGVQRSYRGSAFVADFGGDPEGSREAINRWVSERTRGTIPDLFPPPRIDPRSRVVLANAVYFKGRWAWPFDARMTGELPFHADGRTSLVPMMRLVHSFGYCEDAGLQLLEIPYRGHALAALIVLPRERDGLRSLERDLKWSALRELIDQVRPRRVALTLPRFKLESGFDLGDPLAGLGMRKAFDPSAADFSGITGRTGDLFLGSVLHRAFAALDEEGTEASAATAAVLVLGRPPEPLPFVVDHPFLFFIRHRSTGALLFVARVEDPT